MGTEKGLQFCGRLFRAKELEMIQEVVTTCSGLSRMELACTVCELTEWKRAAGGLKGRECLDLLERMEKEGYIKLPEKQNRSPRIPSPRFLPKEEAFPGALLTGSVEAFAPVELDLVEYPEQRRLYQDIMRRYHYLGYAMPYGARLQYLVYVTRPERMCVGAVQFSSPAWKMKPRDVWIGWDHPTRIRNLQHIVNNSRLLLLPKIRNLASTVLSLVLARVRVDWYRTYAVEPYLAETLVDRARFHGGCYLASNWILVGETTGRGRMDKTNDPQRAQIKTILVYPLVKDATRRLRSASTQTMVGKISFREQEEEDDEDG